MFYRRFINAITPMRPMIKFDYVLLARHFRGDTSDDEDRLIASWENGTFINGATYQRLFKLHSTDNQPITILKREETIAWKKILTKLFEDDELKEGSSDEKKIE